MSRDLDAVQKYTSYVFHAVGTLVSTDMVLVWPGGTESETVRAFHPDAGFQPDASGRVPVKRKNRAWGDWVLVHVSQLHPPEPTVYVSPIEESSATTPSDVTFEPVTPPDDRLVIHGGDGS